MAKLARALVIATLVLLVGAPVVAGKVEPIGPRLNLLANPTAFAANSAFHVKHGFALAADQDPSVGLYSFKLDVDGTPRALDFVQRFVVTIDGQDYLVRFWGFNFAAGLPAGAHTFVGHWFGPCGPNRVCGPGQQPNTIVELDTQSRTVTFS